MKKGEKTIIYIVIGVFIFITGCAAGFGISHFVLNKGGEATNSVTEKADTTKNETSFSEKTDASNSKSSVDENAEYSVQWKEDGTGFEFGNAESKATIENVKIANSSFGYVLIIDFKYTNNSQNSREFINDENCNVSAYQNGIEIETPGNTSDGEIFNYNNSFKQIKGGATIDTQLVFVLDNTQSPVEIELGLNKSNYKPQFSKTVEITKR